MENIIIIAILAVILFFAVRGTITHMKGEGDCCGGPKEKAPKKRIAGRPIRVLKVGIKGMHCDNCKNRIEKHLNELDGVVAHVKLARETATIKLYKEVSEDTIRSIIEGLDFKVVDIR